MAGVDPNPSTGEPTPAKTAAEAAAIAGAGVGFRGTYGGARGPVAQDYAVLQQEQVVQRQQQTQQNQQRQELAIAAARSADMMRAVGYNVLGGQETYDKIMGNEPTVQQSSRTYLENLNKRSDYFAPSQIGDTETQRSVAAGENMGTVLESQRKAAVLTPGTRDDQYYLNELSKWNRTGIVTSSEYHYETKVTGLQQKANPYENWGDVALAVEKGGNLKDFTVDKYGFNPNVGGALGYTKPMKYGGWESDAALGQQLTRQVGGVLPGGQGLQETAWTMAKTGKAANVDFQPAIDYVNYQKGRMGPYGALYGGIPDTTPNIPPGRGTPGTGAGTVVSTAPVGGAPLSKDWNPFVASAAAPTGYISEGIQIPHGPDHLPNLSERLAPAGKVIETIFGGLNMAISVPVGVASLLTFGAIPEWAPKSVELIEPSTDPLKETIVYGTPTTTISGGNQTITNLGAGIQYDKGIIAQNKRDIDLLLTGKVVGGKFSGTTEEFAVVTGKIATQNDLVDIVNKNVETYNAMQKENPIIETTTTPQTTLITGTPDKVYRFGYWQKASEEFGNKAMGALGYNRQQLEAYGTVIKSKPGIGGEAERFVYNVMKPAIESPMDLPIYYLEGKMIGGLAEGVTVPYAAKTAEYSQKTGTLPTIVKVLTQPGEGGAVGWTARNVFKWSLPATFVVSAGYQATNKGTDFSKETVLTNLESGVMPMALMTYGAMGTEPFKGGYDYTKERFKVKPDIRETYKSEATLTERPDIQVPSGIGGEMRVVETKTIATQPSINIAGYDITFPRIFEPKQRGAFQIVTQPELVDMGRIIGARLPGTTTEPVVYSRVVETVADTYRGKWIKSETGPYAYERPGITQATGTLKTAEMRLPHTIEEYLKMGAEDAKLTGQPQEVVTAQLMADAIKVTKPVTGYRELSTTVPAGTPIEQVFDWNVMKVGGKEVQFGKIEMEDYFGKIQVTQTGGGVSDYQITVTRDITEEGFLKGGSYDVTGSQVPEAKIVRQLQEASRNLKPGYSEEAYAFDNRGNVIYHEVGEIGSVSREGVWDAIGKIEGSGSGAHTHTPYKLSISEGIPALKEWLFEQTGKGKYPSQPDMGVYTDNAVVFTDSHAITADYIVSKTGVSIFREPTRGWEIWKDILKETPKYVEDYPPSLISRIGKEGGMQFVGKNELYRAPGLTERISDVSGEMQGAYPVGVRNQFIDMIDRVILKDPNLEFVREGATASEKPWHSASTLGKGGAAGLGGGGTMGGGRLVSQQVQTPQELVQFTQQPQMFKSPEIVRAAPAGQLPRQVSEPVLVFGQIPSQIQIPTSKQSQKVEPRFMIEPARAFIQPQMQVPRQDQLKEATKIFEIGSAFKLAQIPEQTTTPILTQDVWQVPLQGQQQTPIQEQAQIQRQLQITRIQPPPQLTQMTYERPPLPPDIGIPFPPGLPPGFGGGGGQGSPRRPRKFWEYFPVGLDISARIAMGGARGHTKKKKGRLLPAKRSKKK